ncbi:MAG: hypothetical protein ABIH34_03615 [Nanoarchaeota archaeon]
MEWGQAENRVWKPEEWSSAQYLINNPDVAGDVYFGVHPLEHWWRAGQYEGRNYLTPISKITDFVHLPECDNPVSVYFGIGKVNSTIHFGEYGYQYGDASSKLFAYPHMLVQEFDSESVLDIKEFKGRYYLSVERGKWKSGVDKAMVYQLQGTKWVEVYRHPRWNLMVHLHVHNGYLYATGSKLEDRSDPAGAVRTADGVNWEVYYENQSEYRLWGMTSLGNDIWFAATSSGMDYGGNNCRPSVFRNKDLIWTDYSNPNDGFWGIAAFKGQIYLGQTGHARVVRFSDKKVVLDRPGHIKITKLLVSEATNILFAFVSGSDATTSGAEVWATSDGNSWYNVGGAFAVPHLFFAYYEPVAKEIWIAGGKFSQRDGGYGRIYKSVRK